MALRFARKEKLSNTELQSLRNDGEDFAWPADRATEIEKKYKGKFITSNGRPNYGSGVVKRLGSSAAR